MLTGKSLKKAILRRIPIRGLTVEADDNKVVLRGRCTAFYHKQVAQETIKPLLGNQALHNHISVVQKAKLIEQLS